MTTLTAQLQKYYDELFPIQFVMKFLSHDSNPQWRLEYRELMFTIPKVGNSESFKVRYLTGENEEAWRALFVLYPRFLQIDVGGVLYVLPNQFEKFREKISLSDVIKRRELVFDIDLSEYKDVRYCCGDKKQCCTKCWTLAVIAVKFLEKFLREKFLFKKLVWLFSGRRGVHCWVMDEEAGCLTRELREAIVSYFDEQRKTFAKCRNSEMHALTMIALECDALYQKFIVDQELFSNKERFRKLVQGMDLPPFIVSDWLMSAATKYDEFISLLSKHRRDENERQQMSRRKFIADELMMQCIFPKLDVKVSTQLDHCLKLPFSVHPNTGMICLPMTPRELEDFDPHAAEHNIHIASCTRERIDRAIAATIEMFSKK